jgi:sulfatase maturation enzyme AslB (radical SAM superfamily)
MLSKKYKTCSYLEHSLYVAPNEIRACCQRFFYKGKMRGDAKLLSIIDDTPDINDIKKAREKLFEEIQNNKNQDCEGCIFLTETDTKPVLSSNIRNLSIEHHSVCNLRCNYCSEVYWGGKRSKYNVAEFISKLSKGHALDNCHQVVWGGGEPTLDKSFKQILEAIHKYANPKIYHRVFTNSVRYSDAVLTFLKLGLIKITTSIDAGKENTFKYVRGRKKMYEVFENLEKYSRVDPTKITIKYIFTVDNYKEEELLAFVENCKKYHLNACNYQISLNYKSENLQFQILKSIAFLFFLLSKNNIKKIFLDDHIMVRFGTLTDNELNELKKYLEGHKAGNIILDPFVIKDLIIYGAGRIAEQMIKKTNFFKNIKSYNLVDSDISKIGKKIFNKEIISPSFIKENKKKIYIASAQNYDDIYKNIISLKGNDQDIISGLII